MAASDDAPASGSEQDDEGRLQGGWNSALPPHDLRHRRISLWHGQGIPARMIGERVGQQQVAVTLDIYSHVMPLDEISEHDFNYLVVAG
jgi:integrase